MLDMTLLASHGVTQERLRKLCSTNKDDQADISKEDAKRFDALLNRIRSRVQDGMTRNLADWQWAYAIDVAYDTPFRQISPTLLQSLIEDGDNGSNNGDWLKKVTGLGLDKFLVEETDKDGKKTGKKFVNAPAFFSILVPLVKSYVTLRRAAIVNRRRQTPLLKYEPVKTTAFNKAKCEALTDRVQVMSTQYGYFEVLDQCVLKMLQYGTCIQFVEAEWDSESELRYATQEDVDNKVKNASGEPCKLDEEIEVVVKEGIRYKMPHPTRTFRDLAYGCYTINSDSGCKFAGFWEIARYRDLLNRGFWNTNAVTIGQNIIGTNLPFFQSVYTSCKMTMPGLDNGGAAAAGVGTTKTDSETQMARSFYGTDQYDQGVLVTNYCEKLVPSENGLGDYNHPVWYRFVLAGDGCTILYGAPLPSIPMMYYGYDPDESRDKNSSLALEVIPFQDQFGMTLSQIILSAKQNLANLTFINEDIVDKDAADKLKNIGEKMYRHVNLITASFKKILRGKNEVKDAIESFTLPKSNVAELTNVLKTILDVCDRVLQVSNLEISQAASHEQSAEEVKTLSGSTDTRLVFTGTPVDNAMSAWKRQIYAYDMAYGDKEFYATIPAIPALNDDQLKLLGFTYVDKDQFDPDIDKYRRIRTEKSIAMPLHEFASNRDDIDRPNDTKAAAAMAQIMQPLINNPVTLQALGADQILQIAETIAHLAGVDRDFKLHAKPTDTPEEAKKKAADQLKQLIDTISKVVDEKLKVDLVPIMQEIKTLGTDVAVVMHATNTVPPQPMQPPTPNAPNQPAPAAQAPS